VQDLEAETKKSTGKKESKKKESVDEVFSCCASPAIGARSRDRIVSRGLGSEGSEAPALFLIHVTAGHLPVVSRCRVTRYLQMRVWDKGDTSGDGQRKISRRGQLYESMPNRLLRHPSAVTFLDATCCKICMPRAYHLPICPLGDTSSSTDGTGVQAGSGRSWANQKADTFFAETRAFCVAPTFALLLRGTVACDTQTSGSAEARVQQSPTLAMRPNRPI
jgi:hypothetical protein